MFRVLNNISSQSKNEVPCKPEVSFLKIRGKNYVFDSNSLCLVEVDEAMVQKLKTNHEFNGLLFSDRVPQFQYYPKSHIKKIVLETTHACNLQCTYCFVENCYEEGKKLGHMDFETAKKGIDKFLTQKIDVGFFGGEPLMNWKLIEEVVEYVKKKSIETRRERKFHITTNATLLDEKKVKFLDENGFSIIVSLDGPEQLHNAHRKSRTGNSYGQTMKGLELLRNKSIAKRVTLRSTFTGDTINLVERLEFLNQICDSGIGTWVSVEPVCLTENTCVRMEDRHPDSITLEMLHTEDRFKQEYEAAADWFIKRIRDGKKVYFHHFYKPIQRLLWCQHNPTECGASRGYLGINHKGDLFACHREYLSEMGNLSYGLNEQKRAKWLDNRLYVRPNCMECPTRYICGGGCRLESIAHSGDIHTPEPCACWFKRTCFDQAVHIISELGFDTLSRIVSKPSRRRKGKRRRNKK